MHRSIAAIALALGVGAMTGSRAAQSSAATPPAVHPRVSFKTADSCLACHMGVRTSSGEDVSIGSDWRGSMMANSARDPYFQAAVRRERIDHPDSASAIEDTCAVCHMPMARAHAASLGQRGEIFRHLRTDDRLTPRDRLAQDGVSCTMCHQITGEKLGAPESFTGGFVVNNARTTHGALFGPFVVDSGRAAVMESASTYRPVDASHMRTSELCATCHTLYTKALDPRGETIGRLPEQVPFLEWQQSAYREEKSCQACHMPPIAEAVPMTSVLGAPREGLARHTFTGANFLVLAMLDRYRRDLGASAEPHELQGSAYRSMELLQSKSATLTIERAERSGGRIAIDVVVHNTAGHKLPTGFPSRRAWLHAVVRDGAGRIVFESGALGADGRIAGNDNDADPRRYEPHYAEIRHGDEVQIYESIVGDAADNVTTGLLNGTHYLKDNRLLPRGFNKTGAAQDIAVVGEAATDEDFVGGGDRVRYSIDVPATEGALQVEIALRFQTIGFRWAHNLERYDSLETRRFVGYYDAMAAESAAVLARASATIR